MNWKKIILWSIAGLLALVLIIGTTVILLLEHNAGFRQKVLAKVAASIEESTGAKLEVRDFALHLSHLSLDLYGVTVRGTEADLNEPLLQTEHLEVGIKILSVLHRKWRLQDVIIDHPVVHVFVNKAGENNLPKPKVKKTSSSQTSIFDLAIQKLVLDRGELYYNDKKSLLDAEVRDLQVNAGFDNGQSRYFGDLGYHQGRVKYGAYAPMVHDLRAHFDATAGRFNLDPLELSTGSSKIQLKAQVDDYSNPNPKMQASYNAVLVADDVKRILHDPSVPSGVVQLDGSLNYQSDPNDPNRPAMELVSLAGQVSSRGLAFKMPSFHGQVNDLGAQYSLNGGNAEVRNIHARLLGGTLNGKLVIHDLSGAAQARLLATLKDVSIRDAEEASGNHSLAQAGITGKVSADADARWAKTMANLKAHSNATIQAALKSNSSYTTPLNGVIHADYDAARQEVALNNSYVRTPRTSLNLDGRVSQNCALQIRMQSNDLHELELMAASFRQPTPGEAPQELGVYGTASFNGTVTGSTKNPQLAGQLAANNLKVKGSSWRILRTNISASPSLASLSNGHLEAVPQGQINFNVQANLKNWAYTSSSPIKVQLSASQLSIADLERLAGQTYPVSGTLAVDVAVHGSQLNPVGQGTITLANAKVSNEPIQTLNLHFKGTGDAVDANLTVKMPAGSTQANATYYPKTESYKAQLHATDLRLEKLEAVRARNMQINGGLNLNASGQGTLKSPELTATVQIPELKAQKETIRGITLKTDVRDHVANIALDSAVIGTYVRANGTVGIDSPYNANLRLDTGRISFQPLLALYVPAQAANMGGQTELHATLRGPLTDKMKMEAHVEVPVLAANYKQVQIAAKPIHLDYQNGVATLQPTALQGTDTDIQMQGMVPVNNLKAAQFLAKGTVDLRLAEMFQPDVQSSGQLNFDINSNEHTGSNIQGTVRMVNANFQSLSAPLGLANANGLITVTRDRLQVTSFEGQVGGGTVSASGGIVYQPAIQFDLAVAAKDVRLRYPEGIRAMLGSNLTLTGTTEDAALTGQVRIERVSLNQDFDLAEFMGQFTGESSPPASQGLAQNIRLNISVQSTSQMNLTSNKVSLQGNTNLRVAGTAADPVILGRANLTGGELFLANNRYLIQNGTVDFLNPIRTEPVVNVAVTTIVQQYNIALHFQGPVSNLRTTYTSDPTLPPVDIINLLARGTTTEAAGAAPPTPLNAGAQALVANTVSGQVSSKIAKIAGISNLSIDPSLGGDQSNPGARIAIQQRVTSNLFVTFASDVTSTGRQQIQLEYKLNPKWSLSGVRDQNGGFGVDAKYHKKF